MKTLPAILLLFCSLCATAKDSTILSVKTLAVGFKYRGADLRPIEELLRAESYEVPAGPLPMFLLTQSIVFPHRLGFYYTVEYGRDKKENAGRSVARQGFGLGIGAAYAVYEHRSFGLIGRAGVNGARLVVRTYDEGADTVSLHQYVHAHTGAEKRIGAQGFGPVLGADVETRMSNFCNAGFGLSYTIPVARADLSTDAGSFQKPPVVFTSTWEAHLQLQFHWARRKPVCEQSHNPFL